jgi:hypothetical protein
MSAIVLTAISALQKIVGGEDNQAAFEVIIAAFDELYF